MGSRGGLSMYEVILFFHSWLRWFLVITLVFVLLKSLVGWKSNGEYTRTDNLLSIILISFLHLQLLFGLVLYFGLSPFTNIAFSNMSFAMKNISLRYWTVEHFVGFLLFFFLLQFGRIITKRAQSGPTKHKRMTVCSLLAAVVLLAMMPWPARKEIGRPLFSEIPIKNHLIAQPE